MFFRNRNLLLHTKYLYLPNQHTILLPTSRFVDIQNCRLSTSYTHIRHRCVLGLTYCYFDCLLLYCQMCIRDSTYAFRVNYFFIFYCYFHFFLQIKNISMPKVPVLNHLLSSDHHCGYFSSLQLNNDNVLLLHNLHSIQILHTLS